ncbi:MAG: tetratricopeptide repeat protein [Acidobacteria bacterium]|nr:tetratricopeptide repeat protein [Acidobacteriota bacterium]
MSARLVRVLVTLALPICAAAAVACTSPRDTAPAGETIGLVPVALPDLSRAEASLQRDLRERHAAIAARAQGGEASQDLGAAYGDLGSRLMAAGFLDAAGSAFLNAQALAPDDMRWPYLRAHALRLQGESARAIPFFERALQIQPDDVPALIWLATSHIDQGEPEAAEPFLVTALMLQPDSLAALFGLGRVALTRRDYQRAVDHFEKALALDPRAAAVHYPLAMAYRGLGDGDKADAHLRLRAPGALTPPDPHLEQLGDFARTATSYEIDGVRALDAGRWNDAAAHFRKGIAIAPATPSLRLNLGTALALAGDERAALEQFDEAIRLSPGYARAHYTSGILLESIGRDQEALDRFAAAVRFDSTLLAARLGLADALRRTGRLDASLAHYQEIVRIDPAASQARFGHAMALVRLGRYQEARAVLVEAMTAHPDQPGFAHAFARLLASAPDERVRDGRRALALVQPLVQGGGIAVAETMAMAQAETGNYEEAAAWQRDAIAAARESGRADLARQMADNLTLYERGQPCRTPWRDDDPVHFPRTSLDRAPQGG